MGLESSPTKISDLNVLWPLATDDPKYGDDHIRNIKAVLTALDTAGAELKGRLVSVQKFTADGTWTKPTGIRKVLVESKGGGGGGAGGYSGASAGAGHGGGGGEGGYCKEFIDVSAVSTVTVTVGDGGAGGAKDTNGSNGENTTFGSYHTAGGGEGGRASTFSVGANQIRGGAGGTATGGDINLPGACGLPPFFSYTGNPILSGAGGGQGGGRALEVNDGVHVGVAGAANSGGGGSGGSSSYGGANGQAGGAGGSGYVVVWEFT